MFLFNRSFATVVAGLAVSLLFVCVDRACEPPAYDTPVAREATAAAPGPAAAATPVAAVRGAADVTGS